MKKMEKIKQAIYTLVSTSPIIKAKSIGTHENTILVESGRQIYEITIKLLERKEP